MKILKPGKQALATLFFMLSLLAGNFSAPAAMDCSCPTPSSVTKTAQTSSSASFAWEGGGAGVTYKVWYVRKSDGFASQEVVANGNAVSFTGMQAGTYTIYAKTICEGGEVQSIIWDDIIIC
jgi:hypothetical protein